MSFNSNQLQLSADKRAPILPDDSKPTNRPDPKMETRKIAEEDDDGHQVNIFRCVNNGWTKRSNEYLNA